MLKLKMAGVANEDEALGEHEFREGLYARADLDEDAGLIEEESEG